LANSALGTKRICSGCAAKFYDLGKDPIVCPTCETVFTIPKAPPSRSRSGYAPRSVYDPNSGPARSMGTLSEETAPAIAEDAEAEAEDVEAKDETEEAEGGVPMLEEIDEK
jgi:uncharacterized protein (TIGR02300 family)